MKKEELVKLGLDEETAEKVAAASTEELKGFVPRSRLNEESEARKKAEAAVKERDAQIEGLKAAGNVDDLKKQIETLQADNKAKDEAHAAELKKVRIDADVEAAMTESGARNHKAVRALLDLENAELTDDGRVKGVREQLSTLAKADDSKFLFNAVTKPKMKGAKVGENGAEDGDKGVDTSKMTYDELCAYLTENPDATL